MKSTPGYQKSDSASRNTSGGAGFMKNGAVWLRMSSGSREVRGPPHSIAAQDARIRAPLPKNVRACAAARSRELPRTREHFWEVTNGTGTGAAAPVPRHRVDGRKKNPPPCPPSPSHGAPWAHGPPWGIDFSIANSSLIHPQITPRSLLDRP